MSNRSPSRTRKAPVQKRLPGEQPAKTFVIVTGFGEPTSRKQKDLLSESLKYGPVHEIYYGDDSEGYIVEFLYKSDAERAVQGMNGAVFDGEVLSVEIRKVKTPVRKSPQRSPRRKHLFIVASTFDEGFDSADALFWADNVEQVAQYMLDSARRYIARGKTGMNKFYDALIRSDWTRIMGEGYIDDPKESTRRFDAKLQSISVQELIVWIDSTYVDGGSNNKISISEYDESSIKEL